MPVPLLAPRSAVTAAYARVTEALPVLTVTEVPTDTPLPSTDGWVTAAALAEGDEALDTFLAWDDEQILRDNNKKARPDVTAGFGLHRYAWPACLLFTAPWFLHRRVPRYPVTHVSYDRTRGPMALAVHPGPFACLPDDPAAALPGAYTVRDEEALRAELREAIAAHMEPLLAAFGPRMRRRGRALWGMVTDEMVEGIWYVAGLFGEHEKRRAEHALDLLLPATPGTARPYVGSPGFRALSGPDGTPLSTRDRVSCCMYYTLDPDDTCATCPRTCDTARIAKLTAAAAS
jgi:hypothetical protein